MKLPRLPLKLSVKCTHWRSHDEDAADADAEFARVRSKALMRDENCCRFCGFASNKWQEVHHLNDDHADNRLDNLVTTCAFCHMCQHIGLAGTNKEAVLIYLPQITQASLNHLVRSTLVAMHIGRATVAKMHGKPDDAIVNREYAEASVNVMAALLARQEQAVARLGSSDPAEVGSVMQLLPDDAYARRHETMAGIRLLPLGVRMRGSENIIDKHIQCWLEKGGVYSQFKPQSWAGVLATAMSA